MDGTQLKEMMKSSGRVGSARKLWRGRVNIGPSLSPTA